jgi:hypothetical protein
MTGLMMLILASGGRSPLETALESHGYAACTVQGLPDSLLPPGVDALLAVPAGTFMEDGLILLAGIAGGDTVLLGEVGFTGIYNSAKADWIWDGETGTVEAWSQLPSSASYFMTAYVPIPDAPYLAVADACSGDPSRDAVEEAWRLVEQGSLLQAAELTWDVMYPDRYFSRCELGAAILLRSHQLALEAWRGGDAAGACSLMDAGVQALEDLGCDRGWPAAGFDGEDLAASELSGHLGPDEAVPVLNDHGFFMLETGRLQEAVELLSAVVGMDPGRAVARLNLADALWGLGMREGAATHYRAYLDLLEAGGLTGAAPERAFARSGRTAGR